MGAPYLSQDEEAPGEEFFAADRTLAAREPIFRANIPKRDIRLKRD
jgi:hypothetical protein